MKMHRIHARVSPNAPAIARMGSDVLEFEVSNLSIGGALLAGVTLLPVGGT